MIEMTTQTSGDCGPVGEFYVRTGYRTCCTKLNQKWPGRGYIRMQVNETIEPKPTEIGHGTPLLYSAMVDVTETNTFDFKLQVKEHDTIYDDTLLGMDIRVHIKEQEMKKDAGDAKKSGDKPLTPSGDGFYHVVANQPVDLKSPDGIIDFKILIVVQKRPEW